MTGMQLRLAIACAALLGLAACGDDDDGGIVLMDGGGMADAGGGVDAGGGADAGSDCPPETIPAPTGMQCQNSTLTCLMGASSAEAQQACITADPNAAACQSCIIQEIYSTCSMAGCDDEIGLENCCLEDECGASPTQACIDTAYGGPCNAVANTTASCLQAAQMARTCGVSMLCFGAAAPATFAPDFAPRGFAPFTVHDDLIRRYSGSF